MEAIADTCQSLSRLNLNVGTAATPKAGSAVDALRFEQPYEVTACLFGDRRLPKCRRQHEAALLCTRPNSDCCCVVVGLVGF